MCGDLLVKSLTDGATPCRIIVWMGNHVAPIDRAMDLVPALPLLFFGAVAT